MAFLKLDVGDLVEDFGLPGLVIGAGVLLLAPIAGPAWTKVGKPIAKTAIKGGIVAYEKSKGVFSEVREAFEDIVAESQAELAEEAEQKTITVEAHSEAG
jgi:hypothetical protein